MSWVKIDDQLPGHPKFLEVGPTAGWLWLCGVTYCSRYNTDGFIQAAALPTLCPTLSPTLPELIESLLAAGLWEKVDGGYHVHDYLDYNPSATEVRERRAAGRRRQSEWKGRQGKVAGRA